MGMPADWVFTKRFRRGGFGWRIPCDQTLAASIALYRLRAKFFVRRRHVNLLSVFANFSSC